MRHPPRACGNTPVHYRAVVGSQLLPNLYDNPSTIAQKELYLKAYSLVMLYDMISKQEKISNAYAIETAAILEYRA